MADNRDIVEQNTRLEQASEPSQTVTLLKEWFGPKKPQQKTEEPNAKQTFDIQDFLSANNVQLQELDPESGDAIGVDDKGIQRRFNALDYLKGQGINPEDVNVQANSSTNPIQKSPLALVERSRIYNEKGLHNYLKKEVSKGRFQGMTQDDSGNLLVKQNGAWYRTDPDFFKGLSVDELAKDVADFAPALGLNMVGMTLALPASEAAAATGAAIGSALGPLGTGAGFLIGGAIPLVVAGLGSGTIRTTFGRIQNTYEATPDEQMQDVMLEGLFNIAGQKIGPGKAMVEGIPKTIATANTLKNEATRDIVTSVFGKLTGVGQQAMDYLIDEPKQLIGAVKKWAGERAGKSVQSMVEDATFKQEKIAKEFLQSAVDELPKKWKQGLDSLVNSAEGKGFETNLSSIVQEAERGLEELGVGRFVKTRRTIPSETPGETGRVVEGKPKFQFFNEEEKQAMVEAGQRPMELTDESKKFVEHLVSTLNSYRIDKTLRGRVAADRLAMMNKTVNMLGKSSYQNAQPDAVDAITRAVTNRYRSAVADEFANQGLESQWRAMAEPYQKYSNSVKEAASRLNREGGISTFINQLVADAGKKRSVAGLSKDIIELVGPAAQKSHDELVKLNAIKSFLPQAPKLGWLQAITGLTALNTGNIPLIVGTVAASSPRLAMHTVGASSTAVNAVGKILPYANKGIDFLSSMTPEQLKFFRSRPQMLEQFFNSLTQGYAREQAISENIEQNPEQGANAAAQGAFDVLK